MKRSKSVQREFRYWASGSYEDDKDIDNPMERNYSYMASNDPPSRNIIQQVNFLLSENNFNTTIFQPKFTKMESSLEDSLKSYQSEVEDREEIHNELARIILHHEYRKLHIYSFK